MLPLDETHGRCCFPSEAAALGRRLLCLAVCRPTLSFSLLLSPFMAVVELQMDDVEDDMEEDENVAVPVHRRAALPAAPPRRLTELPVLIVSRHRTMDRSEMCLGRWSSTLPVSVSHPISMPTHPLLPPPLHGFSRTLLSSYWKRKGRDEGRVEVVWRRVCVRG